MSLFILLNRSQAWTSLWIGGQWLETGASEAYKGRATTPRTIVHSTDFGKITLWGIRFSIIHVVPSQMLTATKHVSISSIRVHQSLPLPASVDHCSMDQDWREKISEVLPRMFGWFVKTNHSAFQWNLSCSIIWVICYRIALPSFIRTPNSRGMLSSSL